MPARFGAGCRAAERDIHLAFRRARVQTVGMFRNLGITEVLIILAVLILLFGAKRIPDLARSLGRSISEFKKGRKEGQSIESGEDDAPKA